MDVNATREWEYVAEGRHHVIVRDKHSKPPHCVLRFKKRIAQHGHEVAWSPNLGSEAPWVRRFVAPQYRPLRNCRKIPVPRPVIAAVNEQIFERRPVGRRDDNLCEECESALLEPDLSRLWQIADDHVILHHATHIPAAGDTVEPSLGLVVEIKPKSNRIIHSPFYSGGSELKHTMGRYSLLQHYKASVAATGRSMPWGEFEGVSRYDPSMLFSGSEVDIRTTLRALLENPQNNLRVSIGGQHVFGWDMADNRSALCEQLMRLFRTSSCEEAFEMLVDCLARVLITEDLLKQMHRIHSFDLFNVEGAAAVFAHLVRLAGSEEQAFELVRRFDRFDEVDVDAILESLRQRLHCHTWRQPRSAEEAEQMREQAQRCLNSLSAEECVPALQLWLHALTVSDCSMMIALQPRFDVACSGLEAETEQWSSRKAGEDRPGLLVLRASTTQSDRRSTFDLVSYTIGLVDVELKSFEKIVSKAVDDAEICRVVAQALANLGPANGEAAGCS